jgi:outer membrane lipase/esterase
LSSVGGHANPNALYLISSGGNDIFIAANLTLATATAYLHGEAAALAGSIATLQADGAKHIMISNEYPIPSLSLYELTLTGILQTAFRQDLSADAVNYIFADTYDLIANVEAHPTLYGITQPLTSNACIAAAGFPGSSGYGETCAPTTTPSTAHGYLASSNALQDTLLVDGIHLTEAGQILIADYYEQTLASPLPATWALMLAGLFVFGFAGYRKQNKSATIAVV